MEELNLATLPKYLTDEHEAWALLERLRWPDGEPVCPHCGTKDPKHYFLTSRSGERTTKAGNITYRRLWKCRDKDCRKQFSVLVGTIFESSKLPVSKWLLALWLMSAGKNAISAKELQRHLGIAYQTAWFVLHRLREAMTREPLASLLSGTVQADETFVGGVSASEPAGEKIELSLGEAGDVIVYVDLRRVSELSPERYSKLHQALGLLRELAPQGLPPGPVGSAQEPTEDDVEGDDEDEGAVDA